MFKIDESIQIGRYALDKDGRIVIDAIRVGEYGRGRQEGRIPVLYQVGDAIVPTAPDGFKAVSGRLDIINKNRVIILSNKPVDSDWLLARINTNGGYRRGANGTWKIEEGYAAPVVHGAGAWGDAGRIGDYDDDLVLIKKGTTLLVHYSRGGDYRVYCDGDKLIEFWSEEDYWYFWYLKGGQK